MTGKSFWEILENQLRREIRQELESEYRVNPKDGPGAATRPVTSATTEAVLGVTLMDLRLRSRPEEKRQTNVRQSVHRYRSMAPKAGANDPAEPPKANQATGPRPEPVAAPRMEPRRARRAPSLAELAALEFFRRHGAGLAEDFTAQDLKAAYRALALKLHPDRHSAASDALRARYQALFSDLTECHALLQAWSREPVAFHPEKQKAA